MRWYTTSRLVFQTFLLLVALTLVVRDNVQCGGTIGAYVRVTGPPPPQRQFSTTTFYNDTNLTNISDLYIHPITRDVYVCSFALHIIVRIQSLGNVGKSSTVIAGFRGRSAYADGKGSVAQFSFPFGIAGDGRDTLYVGDQNNHKIRSINISNSSSANVSTLAGNGSSTNVDGVGRTASIKSPCGVALDPNRTVLYVASFYGNSVRMVNLTTLNVSTIASTTTSLPFEQPVFVAVSSDGNHLFVSISKSQYVARIDLTTNHVTNVTIIPSTTATTPFLVDDPYGTSPSGTYEPYGVLLTPDASMLIVADHTFDAVRCVRLAGAVGVGAIVTIAGDGTGGYADASPDNTSSSFMAEPSVSMLNAPQGMGWWQTGNSASSSQPTWTFLVADYFNGAVRAVTLQNNVFDPFPPPELYNRTQLAVLSSAATLSSMYQHPSSNVVYAVRSLTQIISLGGQVTVPSFMIVAGNTSGSTDGAGDTARFQSINGMTGDDGGEFLYVADNNTVRRVSITGAHIVVTLINNSTSNFSTFNAIVLGSPCKLFVAGYNTMIYMVDLCNGNNFSSPS